MKKSLIATSVLLAAFVVSGCSTTTKHTNVTTTLDCQKKGGNTNAKEFIVIKLKNNKTGKVLFVHSSPISDSLTPVQVNDFSMVYTTSYFPDNNNLFVQVGLSDGRVESFGISACDSVVLTSISELTNTSESLEFSHELR
ncbi:hypothetical protein PCI56_04405 [Plesiomonas shigelloides subsp. oncorhynchi]|nr:hypothetical protein [Plesiomonas shigelloides]